MYLTIHAAGGALIGHYIENPGIAFMLGIISHYFFDMLPHYDSDFSARSQTVKSLRKKHLSKIVGLIYLNVSIAILVGAAILTNNIHFLTPSVFWGIIGAILPDILTALEFFFRKNFVIKKINEFHDFLHYHPQNQLSVFLGGLTQVITLIIIVRPLI